MKNLSLLDLRITTSFYRVFTYTQWCAQCSLEQTAAGDKAGRLPAGDKLLQTILILSSQTLEVSDPALVLQLYPRQVEALIQLLFLPQCERSVDIYKLKAGPLYPDNSICG